MDSRTVEQLIQAAATSRSDADYARLFAGLPDVELFLNITEPPRSEAAARPDTAALSTPIVDVGNGRRAIVLYTSKDNSKLKKPFGGLRWKQALEMLVNMPMADGMVIEGADLHWVAIDKARAQYLLQTLVN